MPGAESSGRRLMPVARRGDPETSWEAADSVTPRTITATQTAILLLLREGPMTDEDIAARVGKQFTSPSGLRTRRSELVSKGLVVDTGNRRKMESGRYSVVWALASPVGGHGEGWECVGCRTRPPFDPQPGIDPSWGTGKCQVCGKTARFRKV